MSSTQTMHHHNPRETKYRIVVLASWCWLQSNTLRILCLPLAFCHRSLPGGPKHGQKPSMPPLQTYSRGLERKVTKAVRLQEEGLWGEKVLGRGRKDAWGGSGRRWASFREFEDRKEEC